MRSPVSPSPARIRSTIANVVDQLHDGRRPVGLSQPLVSWHLGKLREVGLVAARREGRTIMHTLVPMAFEAFEARQMRSLGLAADPTRGRQTP